MQKPNVGKRSVDLVRAVNTPPNIPLLDLQSERLHMRSNQITQLGLKYITYKPEIMQSMS